MRLLIISLTHTNKFSPRAIQLSKVVNALQSQGIYTTIITINNKELKPLDPEMGKVIRLTYNPGIFEKYISKIHPFFGKSLENYFPYTEQCIRQCVEAGESLLREKKYDGIISSSNPLSSHLAGLILSKKTGLPWVASFSDPRPVSILPFPYRKNGNIFKSLLEKAKVEKVLTQCDGVHMPSSYGITMTEERLDVPIRAKSHVIPHVGGNGINSDNNNFAGWLVHTGKLKRRLSDEFLEAVKEANRQIPGQFKGLLCVGGVDKRLRKKIRKNGMESMVRIMDEVPPAEALSIMGASGALLVMESQMEFSPFLPSKFADYAHSGKPILAITPKVSAVRDYLEKFGGGIAVDHNRKQIREALISIFSDRDRKKELARAGRQNLAPEFSALTIARQYKVMIEESAKEIVT